jgi:hypothetical protein
VDENPEKTVAPRCLSQFFNTLLNGQCAVARRGLPIKSAVTASNVDCLSHAVGRGCFVQIIAAHDLKPRLQSAASSRRGPWHVACVLGCGGWTCISDSSPVRRRDHGAHDFHEVRASDCEKWDWLRAEWTKTRKKRWRLGACPNFSIRC